jgi:16S rRNA (cytidine1402-2'-O)-methyltransferase
MIAKSSYTALGQSLCGPDMGEYSIGEHRYHAPALAAGLYVVATPIGNLGDITLRALQTLAGADCIACEDKRVSSRLLDRYAIRSRLLAYHDHNADRSGPQLIEWIRQGKSVALISDAGTPLISDPGFRLVRDARAAGLPVWPIPGPSAPIAALSASGIPADHFHFEGFLPSKSQARRSRLGELKAVAATLVFYESPNRMGDSLADMSSLLGEDRQLCVYREITKRYEEAVAGSAKSLAERFGEGTAKGEFVIIAAPPSADAGADPDAVLAELLQKMKVAEAAAEAAALTGLSKRLLYQRALELSRRTGKD